MVYIEEVFSTIKVDLIFHSQPNSVSPTRLLGVVVDRIEKFKFDKEFILRLKEYLASEQFLNTPKSAKSDYWVENSSAIKLEFNENAVIMTGKSGFYLPPRKSLARYTAILRAGMSNPFDFYEKIKIKFGLEKKKIQMMSHFEAFDFLMSSKAPPSPYWMNFEEISLANKSSSSIHDLKKFGQKHGKYNLHTFTILSNYYFNILNCYMPLEKAESIVEIGAGNGNLLTLFFQKLNNVRLVDVDLPETIAVASVFLADMFPNAKMLLPHEAKNADFSKYDFVFLTPNQVHLLPDDSVDLIVNTDSFQEMTHEQIADYFRLVQRIAKNKGHFFTRNRVEKLPLASNSSVCKGPSAPLPNRFAEYPWVDSNETILYETCKLSQLVKTTNSMIKLQKVVK